MINQEKRYRMYCMNNKEYIIDEEDLRKLNENSDKMLVRLKQCIVHPTSIIAIEPFFIAYKRNAIEDPTTGKMRLVEPTPPEKLEDLFNKPNSIQLQ